VVTLD